MTGVTDQGRPAEQLADGVEHRRATLEKLANAKPWIDHLSRWGGEGAVGDGDGPVLSGGIDLVGQVPGL